MKKFKLLVAILICSMLQVTAATYLVHLGTQGSATWDAGASGTVVNLSTVNGGNPASFNAWFADKSLATPTFAGAKFLSGDQVWVITGTYYLTGAVTLKEGVSIYGGFSGIAGETIATRAKNSTDKWDFSSPTVFDGSVNGTKTYTGITSANNFVTTTTIDGITIQNCTNSTAGYTGGAGKIEKTTTMQNCIVTACTATGSIGTGASAGISVMGGATLKDSYIHHNTSTSTGGTCGGGVAVSGTSTVSGCKIESNTSNGNGGGLYLYSGTSGVSITDCIFTSNYAASSGGGIGCYITGTNTNPISISNCTFTGNSSPGNGGAANLSSSIAANVFNVTGCIFTSNYSTISGSSTSNGGGAVALNTSTFTIDKCTFKNNYTTLAYGGAMYIATVSSCTISNSKFIANTAGSTTTISGAAIYCKSNYTANNCLFADNTGSTPIHFYGSSAVSTFQNCTFANNLTSAAAAAPIQLLNIGSSPYPQYLFTNCLFYKVSGFSTQTSPTTTTCASDRALSTISITGITSADFVDETNATKENRDYSLASGSLAINQGTDLSAATSPITKDILGNTRPTGALKVDIGAYEIPTVTDYADNSTINISSHLVVNSSKTFGAITIAPGGKLTNSSALTVTSGITLQSDATGTATLLNSGTYSGTVTAQQFLGTARNWYVSSPVSSATSPATNISRYYEYVEAGNNADFSVTGSTVYWKGLNTGTTMTVGKGYIAQASAGSTVSFSGTPNNGDITTTFDLTRNDAKGKGFNLVGNPYPSYIDWTDVATANPNLDNTYYYRTKNTSGAYTFVTWNGAGSSYVVGNGTANTTITRYIPPTQAFWVRVKTGTGTTKMYFNNGMREHRDDNGNLMKARKQDNRISIRLQLQNGINADELLIYQDVAASNGYDAYDSPKMMNNSASVPDLYSKVNDERLVINGLNTITDNTEIPLGFSLATAATLKLKASELSNLPEGTKLYLRDKQENKETELTPITEYSFTTTTAIVNNESRFSLVFRAPDATTATANVEKERVSVFVNTQNQITIIAKPNSNYAIYNAVGQLIENGTLSSELQTTNYKLQTGIFVVKVNNQSTRVIVK